MYVFGDKLSVDFTYTRIFNYFLSLVSPSSVLKIFLQALYMLFVKTKKPFLTCKSFKISMYFSTKQSRGSVPVTDVCVKIKSYTMLKIFFSNKNIVRQEKIILCDSFLHLII